MKRLLPAIFLICIATAVYAVGKERIGVDEVTIGTGTAADKDLIFDVGDGASNPKITATSGSLTTSQPLITDLIKADLTNETPLKLFEAIGNGSNFTAIKAPSALAGDNTYSLPDGDGGSTNTLATDGAGNLFWQNSLLDPMTARGDIVIRNSSNLTDRLPIGTVNKFLSSDGLDAIWVAISGGAGGHITDGSITFDDLATNSVTAIKMADSSVVGGTAGTIQDGTVTNADINAAAGIVYGKLSFTDNIVSGDIAPNAIGVSEMDTDSVGAAEIIAGGVREAEIDTNAVTTVEIKDSTIAEIDMAPGSVSGGTNGTIVDQSIESVDIGAGEIGSSEMANGAVVGGAGGTILDQSIVSNDIGPDEVKESEIDDTYIISNLSDNMGAVVGSGATACTIANEKHARIGPVGFASWRSNINGTAGAIAECHFTNLPYRFANFTTDFEVTGTCAQATDSATNLGAPVAAVFARGGGGTDDVTVRIIRADTSNAVNYTCVIMYEADQPP